MKRFAKIALTVSSLIWSLAAFAQGTEALPFLRIDRNPVTAGTAFAGNASTSTIAYSAFRNASVIPFYDGKLDASASLQLWAPKGPKTTNLAFGAAYKVSDKFGFSLGAALQNGASYTTYDDSGNSKGQFTPKDMVVNAGLGFKFTDALGIGADLRFANQKSYEGSTLSAFAADVFAFYKLSSINLTAGISNIGSSVKGTDNVSYKLPTSLSLGGAWNGNFGEKNALEVLLDADYFFSGSLTAALGANYTYDNLVSVRAGYHLGTSGSPIPSFLTLGAGVKFSGFRVDLAFLTANEAIGNTITFGLGYSF